MPETNWNKINQFLLIAFSIAWASVFFMRFSQIQYGTSESLSIIALLYMPAPAIAALITQRILQNKGLADFGFTIKGISWIWILLYSPLLYLVFFLGSLLAIYVLGNQFHIIQFGYLDFSNEHFFDFISNTLKLQGNEGMFPMDKMQQLPISIAPFIIIIGVIMAYIVGCTINLPFAIGEELGWRGLLQTETKHWGFWRSNLFIGSLWGLWHGPLIMMGHTFPSYPIAGIGIMVLYCISLSFILSYIRFKSKTVFGPAAFRGMINASSGMALMLIVAPNELFGSIAGISGVLGTLLVLAYILVFDRKFISDFSLKNPTENDSQPPTTV
jgi:uncharacterized protein